MTPSRWALAVLAGAALVLAACSSSPSPPKHATTTTRATHVDDLVVHHDDDGALDHDVDDCRLGGVQPHLGLAGQGQGAAGTITGS